MKHTVTIQATGKAALRSSTRVLKKGKYFQPNDEIDPCFHLSLRKFISTTLTQIHFAER